MCSFFFRIYFAGVEYADMLIYKHNSRCLETVGDCSHQVHCPQWKQPCSWGRRQQQGEAGWLLLFWKHTALSCCIWQPSGGCGSGVELAFCYRKVAGFIPLVCMSKCPWAISWNPNCLWCAGQHLAWQPPPSLFKLLQVVLEKRIC